jgi:heat shock protein HtpX
MTTIASNVILRSFFFGGRGRKSSKSSGGGVIYIIVLVIGLLLIILSPIIATLIRLAISRRREFLADADGALATRYPAGLASALKKISANSQVRRANNATAHLFIANPFSPKNRGALNALFNTHPPVEERIKRLEEMSLGIGVR